MMRLLSDYFDLLLLELVHIVRTVVLVIWAVSIHDVNSKPEHCLIRSSTSLNTVYTTTDSDLSLAVHVNHVTSVGLCFFYLCQLFLIRCSLTTEAAHALVRALIHNHLDYCNGQLAGLPDNQLTRLQSVLRMAAQLIIWVPSHAPVSAAMCDCLLYTSDAADE